MLEFEVISVKSTQNPSVTQSKINKKRICYTTKANTTKEREETIAQGKTKGETKGEVYKHKG